MRLTQAGFFWYTNKTTIPGGPVPLEENMKIKILIPLLIGGFLAAATGGTIALIHHLNKPQEVCITVFVHGIMSIKPHLSLGNFIRFMADDVEDTVYSRTVEYMRQDPFFEKNQAMQGFGLIKIDPTRPKKENASDAFAQLFDQMVRWVKPQDGIERQYYTYGWAGLLSPSRRYADAIGLYQSLYDKVAKLKKRGIKTKIRLVGYSHGANVCLNLACVKLLENVPKDLTIDELILIGMPVQNETDYFVADPMFKKVYHIYSRGDRIQKLDFFSTKRFFSRRVFKERKDFKLPDNLVQIQLRVTRAVRTRKNKAVGPNILNLHSKANLWGKASKQRDASPGHIELWFFGWTPANYRTDYILTPLPLAVFTPVIIDAVEKTKDRALEHKEKKPILVDIRPEIECMVIKNQKSNKNVSIADFPTVKEIHKMREFTHDYKPDSYTAQEYDEHINDSYDRARNEYIDEHATHKHKKHHKKSSGNFKATLVS